MSIYFKKVQNNNKKSNAYGKWYARSVVMGSVNTNQLAEEISHSTTVTYADTVAVLAELAVVMKAHLQRSCRVILDGIGSFKVSLSSKGASSKEELTANNIRCYRINYRPVEKAYKGGTDENGNTRMFYVKEFLRGVTASLLPNEKAKDASDSTDDVPADTPSDGTQQ